MVEGSLLHPSLIRAVFYFTRALCEMAQPDVLFFVTTADHHDGGCCDSDAISRETINFGNAYSNPGSIYFRLTVRLISEGTQNRG